MTEWFRLERISGGHQDPPVFWFLPVASFVGSGLRTPGAASPVLSRAKYDLLWPALCNTAQDAIGLLSRSSIGLVTFDLLSTSIPRSSSAELPSIWVASSMWLCLGLFLPTCISLFDAKLYFPSFSPVSKGLSGFFVLALFMKYFQHLFYWHYIYIYIYFWMFASGFHCIQMWRSLGISFWEVKAVTSLSLISPWSIVLIHSHLLEYLIH